MATEEQWQEYTGCMWEGKPSGNALHAIEVRKTPLEAKAILDLLWKNMDYATDSYYTPLWRPVEMRVEEFYQSIGETPPPTF
jgi:hypothetical protein